MGDNILLLSILPLAVIGLVNLLFPQWSVRMIEKRMREGDDRFLDEQRFYQAYPWKRNVRLVRLSGAGIVLVQIIGWTWHFHFR